MLTAAMVSLSKKTTNMDGSGSRQLSSTQQGSAGYTVGGSTDGKGGGGKGKKNPFSAKLEASGAVSVSHTTTETYECSTANHVSCKEFDNQNQKDVDKHLKNQGWGRVGNSGAKIKQTPDSTSTSWDVKLKLEASASASASFDPKVGGGDKNKDKEGDKNKGKGGKDKGTTVAHAKASVDLNISGEAGYTYTTTKDASGKESSAHKFNLYRVRRSICQRERRRCFKDIWHECCGRCFRKLYRKLRSNL